MTGWLERHAHRWFPVYLAMCLWLTSAALLPMVTNPFAFTVSYATPVRVSTAHGSSATTAPAWGATTTAGNLGLLTIACQNNSSATNSVSSFTGSGWVAGPTKVASSGTQRAFVALYYKENLSAGEGTPTFTISGANTTVTILQEWSGIVTASTVDVTLTGGTQAGSGTLHIGANSTTNNGTLVYCALATRSLTVGTGWGGGESEDDAFTSSSANARVGTQTLSATASVDPTYNITAGIVAGVGIAFKRATV